jgi:hypothetical protein
MKTYNIRNQGCVVFPGTYSYKLYEKAAEKLHKTIRHQITFDNQILKEVQKELVKETTKNLFSLYHLYAMIPSCIKREAFLKESVLGNQNGYPANTSTIATMVAVSKNAQNLYLNLLDLRLVSYLIHKEEKYLGYDILDAGEFYHASVYQEFKKAGFDLAEDVIPEDMTKFIKGVIFAIQFAKEDCPVQLDNKECDLTARHHEVLKAVVGVLSLLFKEDYYSDILGAENAVLAKSSNDSSFGGNLSTKEGVFSKFCKLFK